ncbi:hypothetical protein BKP45_08630 [Anaerobacillus alkalidiazotrophicus]|uniref:PilZ domain-containing protein n=1 Tax=Anaerobacillus alkalidiazotrophicus TaxID=472963 RepID=A0A1S2M7H8_9BACI|nr:PilZ domain-containing protein [Anaerobacillus alkalidiazotrophicus]OIJ20699.1 hypothetical protein BKP45_08630 [Anaerobacillus alkalidiazotrophicus]
MRFRREDTFRYQFEEPVECNFRIIKVEKKDFTSKSGKAQIYDISEGGLKLTIPLDIPLKGKNIEIEVSFKLNEEDLKVTGILIWSKNMYTHYSYGVQFTIDHSLRKKLIEELKVYSKGIAVIKKKRN